MWSKGPPKLCIARQSTGHFGPRSRDRSVRLPSKHLSVSRLLGTVTFSSSEPKVIRIHLDGAFIHYPSAYAVLALQYCPLVDALWILVPRFPFPRLLVPFPRTFHSFVRKLISSVV